MQHLNIDEALKTFETAGQSSKLIEAFMAIARPFSAIGMVAADFSASERSDLLLYTSMPDVFTPLDEASPWWSDDPVVARLSNGEMRPFTVEEAWKDPLPSAADRWEALSEAGINRGYCFPTSRPDYIGGVIIFLDPNDAEKLNDHLNGFHILSTYLHAFMTDLDPEPGAPGIIRNTLRHRPKPGRRSKLSPREVECLRWCALGKTAEEIAGIEGISAHTVRGYLKSALAKLDSRTQAQAVARAIRYGVFKV